MKTTMMTQEDEVDTRKVKFENAEEGNVATKVKNSKQGLASDKVSNKA